jgi:type II secretory pathway pseudopilin PulG
MEMLAVVAIVTILAGLLIPVIGNAKNQAKNAKARAEIDALRMAMTAFYREYGYWPATAGATWDDLSAMLNGNIRPYNSAAVAANSWAGTNNFRAIHFMDFNRDSVDTGGNFVDPFGTNYCIIFDNGGIAIGRGGWTDGTREDNQVPNPGGGQIQGRIAIYSWGSNKIDENGATGSDDVKSWSN